jgi:diguanylate cyclase (GGDEF)-like protein
VVGNQIASEIIVKRLNQRDINFFLLISLPLVIAALGMMWDTSTMLGAISVSVDRQEESRTWQAVQSAVGAAEERLAGTVRDNAHWDDAVTQTYGPIDAEWMFTTWGVVTTDINFDTMYVVNAKGGVLYSSHQGVQSRFSPQSYFGDSLQRILKTLPKNGTTFDAVSTLVNTPDGLAIMAAAPILPTSEHIKIPTELPNVLIFARSLTKDILAKMSEQYIVDGLDILPVGKSQTSGNLLYDLWGNPVAVASWHARHPGDAARESYRFSALATILALLCAMVPISVVHSLALKKIDRSEKLARFAARHDSLSGLPNRVLLLEELTKELGTAKKSELALIFIDLDGFKAINDAYDHETGDMLIRAVSTGLSTVVAGEGILARLGGDEFAILLSGNDAVTRAETIARNVLTFVKDPFDLDGRLASIGASIGIAELEDQPLEPAELMRRADIAMYDAKDGGRNRWRRFDGALDVKRSEDVIIANEIRAFIDLGVFDVAYQPMVDSRNHKIVGVEALARWPKSSRGDLAPDHFIRVAEEHGLIERLGSLILQIACHEMAQYMAGWQDLRLAVNISPSQINNPNFVADIKRIVGEHCIPLTRFDVEFTESVLIANPKRAKEVVQELQDSGVSVALDDFGSGYASVGYLREYGFDKIKLDQSLTRSISKNIATQQIVHGTILIAKGLSAYIIAEGVETEEAAQLMRLAGCQQLQGFYFGKPQTATDVGKLLDQEVVDLVEISA